ncbi:MAG: hypothetical protein KC496_05760 [Anaerolineae bacterium]|nr:hypothetical protein [Anaerolineae bacterium]
MENTPSEKSVEKKPPRRGCIGVVGWGIRQTFILLLGIILIVLTISNLVGSSTLFEACGLVHPIVFEIDVDTIILEDDDRLSFARQPIPWDTEMPDSEIFAEDEVANYWESCVQYWGYVAGDEFRINVYGIDYFAPGITRLVDEQTGTITFFDEYDRQVELRSEVVLSAFGTLALYLFVPGLVVLLPIITVFLIRRESGIWWVVMLSLVAAYVLTSSLLYISLADVSNISALTDFGSGIFGAVTTGTAIAFMGKGLENFG